MIQTRALLFDFDGLILDTETPEYQVWKAIYREHGFELPDEEWGKIIGGYGISSFDAAEHLALLSQGRLDSVSLRDRHRSESHAITLAQAVLPGVVDYLQEAKRLGLKLAIASSSPHSWVDTHARRLGVFDYFDRVICADRKGVGCPAECRARRHPVEVMFHYNINFDIERASTAGQRITTPPLSADRKSIAPHPQV